MIVYDSSANDLAQIRRPADVLWCSNSAPLHALMRRDLVFAVRDERNSPMIHNRAPLARLLLLEGESYEEISL